MKTITILAHKGGTGKTTISISLYFAFTKSGVKTCIVDTDPQKSLSILNDMMGYDMDLKTEYNKAELQDYQISIVDTPPYFSDKTNDLVQNSDIVLIPCKPSIIDAIAAIQLYNEMNEINNNLFVFFNMWRVGANIEQIKTEIKTNNVQTLKTSISDRVVFQKILQSNGDIFKGSDPKAINEITILSNEIYSKLLT